MTTFFSGCWCFIINNIFSHIPESLQLIIGPLKIPFFCHLILFIKNVLTIQYTALLTATSVAKYIFIFVRKNSLGRHEDFWCFFVNAATLGLSFIFQFTFQFLPGRKPYMLYQCISSGESVGGTAILNVQLYLVLAASLTVFITVHIQIKLYQLKSLRTVFPSEREHIEKFTKSTLAGLFTLLSFLALFGVGALASVILNNIDQPLLTRFPYYQLALMHQHFLLLALTSEHVLSYYVTNAKLRDNVFRELKSILLN